MARCNYLASDRPDIQFATRVCSSGMANPKPEDWARLKRLGRYIAGVPQITYLFEWQRMPKAVTARAGKAWPEDEKTEIRAQSDSDWAGNHVTRRSVNGGAIFLGWHLLRSWSKEQPLIALSSGEAELYAANFGAQQALGLRSLAQDMEIDVKIGLELDASAAIGILERQGLGKVRRVQTNDLWLQE